MKDKVSIDIDIHDLDSVVRMSLESAIETLENVMNRHDDCDWIYTADIKREKKRNRRHLKALKRVLKYYGGPV